MSYPKEKLLFIDYETNKNMDFYIVGFSRGQGFVEQVFLDSALLGLAKRSGKELSDPLSVTKRLLSAAKKENATIVAFSEAEKNIFKYLNSDGDLEEFRDLDYLNLAKASKLWIRKCRKGELGELGRYLPSRKADRIRRKSLDNSLASRMRLLNFHAPKTHAPGLTTSRFNAVKSALNRRHQDFSRLTSTQKRKATCATKHNEWDVLALPVLLKAVQLEYSKALVDSTTKCLA